MLWHLLCRWRGQRRGVGLKQRIAGSWRLGDRAAESLWSPERVGGKGGESCLTQQALRGLAERAESERLEPKVWCGRS